MNADQTVIMIWDAAQRQQHFVRQASFKTAEPDVGFIVPSPSRPELAESGNDAFPRLKEITAPVVIRSGGGSGCGCAIKSAARVTASSVRVIEEKRVAGFDATVLTADSSADLTEWLQDHGYVFSPQVAAWAQPYLGGAWHFTALKVAKTGAVQDIKAGALRLTFQTERPLFPYREPESAAAAKQLGTSDRLLRIYFIAEGRYRAEVAGREWSAGVAWSGDISHYRTALLQDLKLPASTGPANWWLTEFEDRWPYGKAAGDVYFVRNSNQKTKSRPDITSHAGHDAALVGFVALGFLRITIRRQEGGFAGRRSQGR